MFKQASYFEHRRKCPDRIGVKDKWIQYVIDNPELIKTQRDGRIKKWAFIAQENKYLRVILLEDGETVHNAFWDRRYQGR